MGALGSLSSGGGGGGGGASSSAASSQNFGSDVYGNISPAAPPIISQSPSWLLPAAIGLASLVVLVLFKKN